MSDRHLKTLTMLALWAIALALFSIVLGVKLEFPQPAQSADTVDSQASSDDAPSNDSDDASSKLFPNGFKYQP